MFWIAVVATLLGIVRSHERRADVLLA